jgi:hypothetical protein
LLAPGSLPPFRNNARLADKWFSMAISVSADSLRWLMVASLHISMETARGILYRWKFFSFTGMAQKVAQGVPLGNLYFCKGRF